MMKSQYPKNCDKSAFGRIFKDPLNQVSHEEENNGSTEETLINTYRDSCKDLL